MRLRSSTQLSQGLARRSRPPVAARFSESGKPASKLPAVLMLVLLLAAIIVAQAAHIPSALAHRHDHGGDGRHDGQGDGGGYGGRRDGDSGSGSGYAGSGANSGSYGSSQHGGGEGGGGNSDGSSHGSDQRGDGGGNGHGSGTASGYNGWGSGGPIAQGDGRLPSPGIPQPEVKGLPRDLDLYVSRDDGNWEKLLGKHWGIDLAVNEYRRQHEHKGSRDDGYMDFRHHHEGEGFHEDARHKHGRHEDGHKHHTIASPAPAALPVSKGSFLAPASDQVTDSGSPVLAASTPATVGSSPAKSTGLQLPGGSRFSIAIDPRSYSHTELLAVNLSTAGYARARTLGFQAGRPSPVRRNGSSTVMMVPKAMDALDAMNVLKQYLPEEQFHLNRLISPVPARHERRDRNRGCSQLRRAARNVAPNVVTHPT